MFDFGLSELMVIAVVGLVVIGPERLPRVARTLGHLFGRMQRYVSEVKADISREMELEELRKLQSSMQDAAHEIKQSVAEQVNFIETEAKQAETEARKAVESAAAPLSGISLLPPVTAPARPEGSSESPEREDGSQLELGLDKQSPDSSDKQA